MKRILLWTILFSAVAAVWGVWAWRQSQRAPASPPRVLAEYGKTPSFILTDQAGRSFNSASMRDKVWIADFIFTSCAGSCPRMSEQMALLQKRLPAKTQLVSITVDPRRDLPAVLAEYAHRYSAQEDRWHFLTGSADDIEKIVQQGFRLSIAEGGSPEEPVTHSVRFVLVDRAGTIRGYYDSTEPSQFDQLIRDASTL